MGKRAGKPRVCGALGKGDACGEEIYHPGPHQGAHTGKSWPADPSERSSKAREKRSRAGSEQEEERERQARTQPAAPHVHPWFRDRRKPQ